MSRRHQVKFRLAPSILEALNLDVKIRKSARVGRVIEIAHADMQRAGLIRSALREPRHTYTAYLTERQRKQLEEIRVAHIGYLGGVSLPQVVELLIERAFYHKPELVGPEFRKDLEAGKGGDA